MKSPYRIARTEIFGKWLDGLKDRKGQTIIARRIERVAVGNLGDVKALGQGLHELRIAFGPGYQVYFTFEGDRLIILLSGGDKGSQSRDIAAARKMLVEDE
ncbi:type II toxin-antitoxin system RelE/ParE family toxin [Sphingorhabdus arenilitoris]|uniref:Type II toxin-antitoxin system RelE/ParE family toxin n=1 Tax=Sphingorhabdus arenilitoris TaxID=1490041 RepID=A0ABV8RHD8_9SPHN